MPKIFHLIDSFTSGEMSPKLRGRTDLAQYSNGLRTLDNFTIAPQGGVDNRTGTKHIAEVKDSSKSVRIIPFEFSTTQAYIIELGDQYMRFYRSQGQILDSTDFTNGDFTSNITSWTDTSVGTGAIAHNAGNSSMDITAGASTDYGKAEQGLILGTSQYTVTLDVISQTLTYNVGTTSGASDIATGTVSAGLAQTFNFTPSTEGAVYISLENRNASTTLEVDNISLSNPIYEIDTPYTESQLFEVQFAQSADVMYMVHGSHEVMKLSRTGNDAWTLAEIDITDGPYIIENNTATTFTVGATSGDTTLTASDIIGINSDTGFKSTDVGRLVRHHNGTEWGSMEITAFTSTTVVDVTITDTLSVTATARWRLGAFSDTTGHPQAVSFHEQRLYFANTANQPQTIWGSRAGSIQNFSPDNDTNADEIDDDTAVNFTIAATKANVIHWIASKESLFLGTSGSIFVAQASSRQEAITPNNISIKPAVGVGSKQMLPIVMQNATIFSQFFGFKLMELGYVYEDDSFGAADLTILSDHIIPSKIKEISRQETPHDIIWVVTDDGELRGLTYLRKEKVIGWHQHTLGGTGVAAESVTNIPGTNQSETYFIVKRTINGATKRYIEVMTDEFNGVKADSWYVDSGLSFTSTDTATITGVTKANPAVVTTSSSHGFSNGDSVKITNVLGMTELNNFTFVIKNVTSTTFELKNTDSTSYTTYTSAGTITKLVTSISGLDHLEGETISILADAATHPTKVVTSGAISLDRPVQSATIGLGYTSILETNIMESKSKVGTIQGSIGRTYKAIIRFYETLNGEYGYNSISTDKILFRSGSDAMDSSPGLFTGDKILEFPNGYENGQKITIKQTAPLPMSILSIVLKVEMSQT